MCFVYTIQGCRIIAPSVIRLMVTDVVCMTRMQRKRFAIEDEYMRNRSNHIDTVLF